MKIKEFEKKYESLSISFDNYLDYKEVDYPVLSLPHQCDEWNIDKNDISLMINMLQDYQLYFEELKKDWEKLNNEKY